MRRRITIMIGGLFLAGMALLPGFAQAAVAQPPARTVSVSATPSPTSTAPAQTGSNIGDEVELFAADAGIAGAIAGLGVGIAFYIKGSRDRLRRREDREADLEAAKQLESLKSALSKFDEATARFRFIMDERVPASSEVSRLRSLVAQRGEVQRCALELVEVASSCGEYYREKAVKAARRLMDELEIEWPQSSELVAIGAELRSIRPSQARKMIERS